jgi:NAD(P)-dependent dehydrogenase (short-subunit alcohol dehydrogenase family)
MAVEQPLGGKVVAITGAGRGIGRAIAVLALAALIAVPLTLAADPGR